MIKINLAKTLTQKDSSSFLGIKTGGGSSSNLGGGGGEPALVKYIVLILPVIGLYFFDSYQTKSSMEHFQTLKRQQKKLTSQLAELENVDNTIKQIEEQKKELSEKFSVIKKIFRLRKAKLLTIRSLQDEITNESWISKIVFNNTVVEVSGYSRSLQEAQSYIGRLTQMKFLYSRVTTKNLERNPDKNGIYRFDIDLIIKE